MSGPSTFSILPPLKEARFFAIIYFSSDFFFSFAPVSQRSAAIPFLPLAPATAGELAGENLNLIHH